MLDTYGMDDINTQAIRELTTVVDRLQNKETVNKESITAIKSEIDNIDSELCYVKFTSATKSVTVPANGNSDNVYIQLTLPEGYTLVTAYFNYARTSSALSPNITASAQFIVSNSSQVIMVLHNNSNADIDIATIAYTYVYKKSVA